MANRGEFTMRAFLNGQLDLSQAEAVADLIASENEASHELAIRQMRGGFSDQIKALRQELIDFAALIELELDFGEEDVEFADRGKLEDLVEKIKKVIKDLLDSFHLGNVIKNGVATVIAGRPNAGKSTLLNAMLNEERAIVSDIAGTTRDTIEESLNIKGIQFRLIDTAGIREAQDSIEKFGVERTLEKIGSSTVVVYMFDVISTKPEQLWADVKAFLNASKVLTARATQIFVANKMDLNPYTQPEDYYKEGIISKANLLPVSALNKMNIEALKDMLYQAVIENPELMDQTIVTNSRHYDALNKAFESLSAVLSGLRSGITGDFIALDIRQALHHLGLITGEIHTDDLLDSIFTRFCIGK
jgi:tRNA modification GTPase